MSVLRFDNVSKQYPGGHAALSEVSFEVATGEMLFVTGHSGAGKSTLLRLVHLAERPSRGAVLFAERNLARVSGRKVAMHRREVSVVFQDHRLLTDRSVFENVALPLILRGMRRPEIGKRVRAALERLGLGARERALPGELSAGEQQRVGIARAIVSEPALLVADEPTGNLDTKTAAEVFDLLRRFNTRFGCAVLVVTHDPRLSEQCDRTVTLVDGNIVSDG